MADQEHDPPGEPPPIRDEAEDSPMWLPALGLSLLLLAAVLIVWRSANAEGAAGNETAQTAEIEQADEGEAEPEVVDDEPNAPR